jgi:ERCC4-type nuclease
VILIDSRVGSKHLAPLIPGAELTQLESADACFAANGITVGIEVKRLMDAVSCMYSGRLADRQLPLLRTQYDHAIIIVEGIWRPEPGSGVLQYLRLFPNESDKGVQCGKWIDASAGQRRLLYSAFESWLTTLAVCGGLRVLTTSSPETTAALISALYGWYAKSEHHSLNVMDETVESVTPSRPTMTRRMLALLPRVGWQRSGVLARRFGSIAASVAAPAEAWLIEGQIALDTAEKIVEALRGKDS